MHFNIILGEFVDVTSFDCVGLEDFFKLNLIVYKLEGNVTKFIQRSCRLYTEATRLNI